MKLILASQSPYRKHALDILNLKYEVIPSNIDESKIRHEDKKTMAKILAEAKAKKVGKTNSNAIIVASDLFVVYKNQVFEKPHQEEKAKEMLKTLSGNTFEIITGLAVLNTKTNKILSTTEICKVIFRDLSDYEINDYVSRYPAIKCAGGFGPEGMLRFAEYVEGNYNFRISLPQNKLIEFLRENNIQV